jgi:hypothetical protein
MVMLAYNTNFSHLHTLLQRSEGLAQPNFQEERVTKKIYHLHAQAVHYDLV